MKNKVVRCANQRALYALARQTIFRIISPVFGSTPNRGCLKQENYSSSLFFSCWVTQHHPRTIDKNVLNDPLDLGEFMRWVGCWFCAACWVGIPDRCDWWQVTLSVMHRKASFRLMKYMSHHYFDEILTSLPHTALPCLYT